MFVRDVAYYLSCQYPQGGGGDSPGLQGIRGDSIITSRPGGRWIYTFFEILLDGKLGVGWYFIKIHDVTVKKFNEVFLYN